MTQAPSPSESVSLRTADLVAQFLNSKRALGRSPATIDKYAMILGFLAQDNEYLPLDATHLENWLNRRSGPSNASLVTTWRTTTTFYSWLVRRGLISGDVDPFPTMDQPRETPTVPRILSVSEVRRVIEASSPGMERALLLVLVDTGARIGELVGLTKDDIAGNTLTLAPGKTGRRRVPLSPQVRGYLETLPTHYLFPRAERFQAGGRRPPFVDEPAAVGLLQVRVRRVLKRSGLRGRKLGPQTLRHTFATHFVDSEGDLISLSKILGHTTTRMSERYVSLSIESLRRKHQRHSLFNAVLGIDSAVPETQLPKEPLPDDVLGLELFHDGQLVQIHLVTDRRRQHTYYYLKARAGAERWTVARLGTDLPLVEVDAYRLALFAENQWRQECGRGEHQDEILVSEAEVYKCIAYLDSPGFDPPCPFDHPFATWAGTLWRLKFPNELIHRIYGNYEACPEADQEAFLTEYLPDMLLECIQQIETKRAQQNEGRARATTN